MLWSTSLPAADVGWRAGVAEREITPPLGTPLTGYPGRSGRLHIRAQSEGMVEALGAMVGQDDRKVKGDLERFKELIEAHGTPSGAWRDKVEHKA